MTGETKRLAIMYAIRARLWLDSGDLRTRRSGRRRVAGQRARRPPWEQPGRKGRRGPRAAELAGKRLCAAGVMERESPVGGIVEWMRPVVPHNELDVAAVDRLVRKARDAATDPGPVSPSLQVVVLGAQALGILEALGIRDSAWREKGPPWANIVAQAHNVAACEFGVRPSRRTG